MNKYLIILSFAGLTLGLSQSDQVTFSHQDSDTPSGYITNNTTGISLAIRYDSDKGAGTSTMVRGVWKSSGGPSDDTDSEYSTLFNLTWNTQHGNSSGSSQFYSGEALTGETHVVNISASQLNAAISSNTSGRLFIHVKHGSTYDDDGYTGIGMDSQTETGGGATHSYLVIDKSGPTLGNIKGFKNII